MSAKDPRLDVIAKAVKDPAFRAELKKAPAAAIEKAVGLKVPSGLTVKVVEDDATTVHLVLPHVPAGLSENELQQVAGGGLFDIPTRNCRMNSAENPQCNI